MLPAWITLSLQLHRVRATGLNGYALPSYEASVILSADAKVWLLQDEKLFNLGTYVDRYLGMYFTKKKR